MVTAVRNCSPECGIHVWYGNLRIADGSRSPQIVCPLCALPLLPLFLSLSLLFSSLLPPTPLGAFHFPIAFPTLLYHHPDLLLLSLPTSSHLSSYFGFARDL